MGIVTCKECLRFKIWFSKIVKDRKINFLNVYLIKLQLIHCIRKLLRCLSYH